MRHASAVLTRGCQNGIRCCLKNGQPFDTVIGPVTFDAKGDILNATYDINVWHDGKYAKLQR